MVYLPYSGDEAAEAGFEWQSSDSHNGDVIRLSTAEALEPYIQHQFADGVGSAPRELIVNGRKGRRAVCVTAEDGIHYRVFDIDSAEEVE